MPTHKYLKNAGSRFRLYRIKQNKRREEENAINSMHKKMLKKNLPRDRERVVVPQKRGT